MASLSVTYTDNGDGTITISTASGGGTAGQKRTTKSLTEACDVAKGWIFQSLGFGLS